ncbi:N-acetylmuramoyl-L-alanine amidase [Bacillus sp. BRMEA1]|uniref:N-acetylmuramoyl-L-alanine amidase n=1 Tax=Neobacillus endophyticus TaxID=2738405 RepID=UPI0015674BFF|nr:N-acetylmuramoyl-L-alanine amidase [Neobacillus endophyticus]NRD80911.1 N-acetylmuramoyl-L-alanine amidase [Neobacillus endophyticus]
MLTIHVKKVLAVCSVLVLSPIFFNPSQKQTAFADMSSSQLNANQSIAATVQANLLNVREHPSLSSKIIGYLKMGAKITVQEEQSGWAKMRSSSGVQGWVYEEYITKYAPAIEGPPIVGKIVAFNEKGQTQSTQSNHISNVPTMVPSISPNSQESLNEKTIVLDPGHGGKDDGTTAIDGVHEKLLTLLTAEAVKQKLENAGANVIMTRTDDSYVPLQQRADISNQKNADAFISVHYNWSSDPSINGITDFYYLHSSSLLASDILKEVVKTTGSNSDGTAYDNLSVLRNNSRPSTLIELGFLSNQNEELVVESAAYRDKVAQGVYQGLLDYFQSNTK